MKVHVNELLTYARLPFHFYGEVTGEDALADNPGKCLLSLCVFKLNQHVIMLSKPDIEAFAACKAFCTEAESVAQVVAVLGEQVADAEARGGHVLVLEKRLARLKKVFGNGSAVLSRTYPLVMDEEAISLFQALIDTKALLEELQELLPDEGAAA